MADTIGRRGLRRDRLDHLEAVIADDIASARYHGAVICVARHGELALHAAIGHGYADRRQPLTKTSVFSLFSVTKAITNVLVFRAIERGTPAHW